MNWFLFFFFLPIILEIPLVFLNLDLAILLIIFLLLSYFLKLTTDSSITIFILICVNHILLFIISSITMTRTPTTRWDWIFLFMFNLDSSYFEELTLWELLSKWCKILPWLNALQNITYLLSTRSNCCFGISRYPLQGLVPRHWHLSNLINKINSWCCYKRRRIRY